MVEPVEHDDGTVYAPPVASWVALGIGVAGFAASLVLGPGQLGLAGRF